MHTKVSVTEGITPCSYQKKFKNVGQKPTGVGCCFGLVITRGGEGGGLCKCETLFFIVDKKGT